MNDDLEPGSPEAVKLGCTCEPADGDGVHNPKWPDWLTRGCPLHDPNLVGRGITPED